MSLITTCDTQLANGLVDFHFDSHIGKYLEIIEKLLGYYCKYCGYSFFVQNIICGCHWVYCPFLIYDEFSLDDEDHCKQGVLNIKYNWAAKMKKCKRLNMDTNIIDAWAVILFIFF